MLDTRLKKGKSDGLNTTQSSRRKDNYGF
jgi:hypothetical protein